MTPRHYINTMMVIFIVNNNINGIFDTVYAILYGLFFISSFPLCLFRVFLKIILGVVLWANANANIGYVKLTINCQPFFKNSQHMCYPDFFAEDLRYNHIMQK